MKDADVIILGAGRAARSVAERLSTQKKNVLMVALPDHPEDHFRNLNAVLKRSEMDTDQTDKASAPILFPKEDPQFIKACRIRVDGREYSANHFVIASGCRAFIPAEFSDQKYLTPAEAVADPPSSVTIIGAGPIGVAIAGLLAQKKTSVTLLARHSRILRREDKDISSAVQSWLESLDVRVELNASEFVGKNRVLATGLAPYTESLALEKTGVCVDAAKRILTDESLRTSNPRIHALGAVTGPVFNFGLEDFQAEIVANNIPAFFFMRRNIMPEPLPMSFPFSMPLARIGLTEKEARAKHKNVVASSVPYGGGVIKLIAAKKNARLLGAHIFGSGAAALVLYFDLLMRAGISLREVEDAHHYPVPEAGDVVKELLRLV